MILKRSSTHFNPFQPISAQCAAERPATEMQLEEKGTMLRDEKWRKHRLAVELWKVKNRQKYLAQKRLLAARPEYLAVRRERYRLQRERLRSQAEPLNLSTMEILPFHEFETGDEEFRRSGDSRGTGTESAEIRNRPGAGAGTEPPPAVQ